MMLFRRSLVPALASALLLAAACGNATGPAGPLTVTTSLSRGTIVPGDTMTISIKVTSLTPYAVSQPQPTTCDFPSFVVKNDAGKVVDQGVIFCVAGGPAGMEFPVASASYTWSAEPYICDSVACRQVPLPAGIYSVIGEYRSASGTIQSIPQLVRVMGTM